MKLVQIKEAINDLLLSEFPDVEIQSSDIREGFHRPSFFVRLDNVTRDPRLYVTERSLTVRIYYFPSNRYNFSLEVMDVQDTLADLFALTFKVGNRTMTIIENRAQDVDGVLEFEFDFDFVEKSADKGPGGHDDLMEELAMDV